jgi:uncharacterized protein (DUF362 family)
MGKRSTVAVVWARHDLETSIDEALRGCGAADTIRPGESVLVKPNIHGGPGTTSPAVIAAVCRWARAQGAARVMMGDGPYFGHPGPMDYFRSLGLDRLCDEVGAELVSFHDSEYRLLRPGSEALPDEIGITRYIDECDVLINLPLMKTHFNTAVTLGIKNLKGTLRPKDKQRLHEMELHHALSELARHVRPQVTLIDAIEPHEGLGPASGTPVDLGLLIASRDIVAADTVAGHIMGHEPDELLLIRLAAQKGVGVGRLEEIECVGVSPASVRRRFRRPHEVMAEDFPGLDVRLEGACSGCTQNLFTALQDNRAAGHDHPRGVIYAGKGDPPVGALLIGNCTRKHWESHPHLGGCPPLIAEVRETLTESVRGG